MKLTKQEVKKNIQHETINGITISYSYTFKSQATLSFMTNERLLIFNQNDGNLYYVNQPKTLPFKTEIPKPKNQIANVNIAIVKNPPGTNDLVLQFVNKNEKNQRITVQWTFTMDNKALAKEWLKVIQDYNAKKIQKITGQTDNKPATNTFIHDTLGFGFMQGSKKEQKSPTKSQEPKKQIEKSPGLNESKKPNIGSSKLLGDELRNNNLKGSNSGLNKGRESDIRGSVNNSKISQGGKNVSPQKIPLSPQKQSQNIRQSEVRISDVRQSNLGASNRGQGIIRQSGKRGTQSPEIKRSQLIEQSRLNKSKVTLRDQLESIMQRSQLKQSKFQQYGIDQSRISNKGNYDPTKDWNLKFLQRQQQQVLLDFEEQALRAFSKILPEDYKSDKALRYYPQNQLILYVSDARSLQAKKLKAQYRNYHFIMESCKENFIVGVPLACLIEFEGLVVLAKSLIPEKAIPIDLTQQILLDLKDLQRYTRIKNNILKKADLYDLSELYDSKGKRMIYIDNLFEYLPVHIEENFQGGFLRPQHILDNVNQFMQGGLAHQANRYDMRTLNDALEMIKTNVKKLAKELSTQDILFANSQQLKNIMHQRGINLKYLPILYNEVSNKNVKKYINTVMVAKVAKDDILQNLASLRIDSNKISMAETVENSYRLLVEGNTSVSNEFWKQIAINFRKQYGIPMSNHDIVGPFFLNCLMKLIPAKYDLAKLNDKKVFFKDEGIINKGFVVDLLPKVKSFSRFTTQLTDKIDITCKEEKLRENFQAIVQELQLKSKKIPRNFQLSKVDQQLKEYLSFYVCPSQLDQQNSVFRHLNLFDRVNQQPPTTLSLKITRNYLDWCLDRQELDKFKRTLEESIIIIDFWFDNNHPYHCEFYECLSNYYEFIGAIEESINFMKESLAIAIRCGGVTSKKTGYKYYELAEKELRAGRKNDSMENFNKAKNNMQNYNDKTIKYPITLMKLSSLYLNASNFEECVIYAKQAVQKFQQLEKIDQSIAIPKGYYDQYCIKAIEIMTRAFEIQNKKAQFYRVAQLSSTKYNKTKNPQVFEQLIKICLTAVIFKHNQQKCQVYQAFLEKIILSQENQISKQRALDELMMMAEQFNVMEKFMFKFQSLERFAADINSRRALSLDGKQFITINRNILNVVGEDYAYGLIQQKEFE